MPIYQFDTPKGVLEFDHDGDPSELTGAVNSFLKVQEEPAAAPAEQPKPPQTGRDLAARSYSGVAKAAADTIVGTSRLPGANPILDLVKAVPGGKELVKSGQEYFQNLGESADAAYGVDEAQNQTIPSKLISGLSSVVPAVASGPLRSITMAGMMGEQSLQDAERKDEQNRLEGKAPVTETQKNIAFGAGAAVGLISEALLGIPALLRSAKAAKIPTDKFMDLVKTVAWQGAKSAPREGIQEWAENTGQNIIANQIAGYDPERGTFEGSGEALLFGAAIGVPVGATVQAAASLDAIKAQSKTTAEQVNTTIDEVAAAEPPPVVDQLVAPTPSDLQTEQLTSEIEPVAPTPAEAEVPEQEVEDQTTGIEVRNPSDNVTDALDSNYEIKAGAVIEDVPIDQIRGGVQNQTVEADRVDKLVEQMQSPEGYISRILVDADGNVVEGQHRFEAFKKLGAKRIPVVRLFGAEDFIPDIDRLKKVLSDSGLKRKEHQRQMISDISEIIMDEKGDVSALRDFEPPQGFESQWNAAIDEVIRQGSGTAYTISTEQISPTGQQPTTPETETEVSPEAAPQEVQATSTGKFSAAQLKDRMASAESRWLSAPDQDTKNKIWDEMQEIDSQYKKATGESMGPGAASAEEFVARRKIGIKNATIDKLREERGQAPLMSEARKSFGETWEEAEGRIAADENYPAKLVDDIISGNKDTINDVEQDAILHEEIKLRNDRDMELERASDESATQEERDLAARRAEEIDARIEKTDQAARKSGTIAGRALSIRRKMLNDDYTETAIERRLRAVKKAPLNEQEIAEIKEGVSKLEKELEIEQKEQQKFEEESSKLEAEAALKYLEDSSNIDRRVLDYASKVVTKWETEAEAAKERLRKRFGVLRAVAPEPDPVGLVKDLALIIRAAIARRGLDQATIANDLIKEFGESIEPYIKQAWDAANEQLNKIGKELPERRRKEVQKKIKAGTGTDQERQDIISGMKAVAKEEDFKPADLDKYIQLLFKNFSDSGMRGLDKITGAVKGVLKPIVPDITERQIQDAFSGYGKSKPAPTDPSKVNLAQIRGEAQKTSALQDILQKKEAPKATGQQRVPQSDVSRRLSKLINEAKKRFNIQPSDPARALKSALDSRKTYYRNKLKDLRYEIGKRERLVKDKSTPPTDPELERIKDEYEEVKAQHDSIFGKPGMTDSQKLAAAIKATERAEAMALKRLEDARRGVFPGKKPSGPTSPILEAARARVAHLRAEAEELRQMSDSFKEQAEQKKIQETERQIAELDRRLKEGEIAPKPQTPQEMSAKREGLVAQRDAMQRQLNEMRKEASRKTPDQVEKDKIAKAQKSLDELDARIKAGNLSSRPKTAAAMSAERSRIAAERAAMMQLLAQLRRAAMPKRTPEEIALQSYTARLKREEADLLDRNARADTGDATAFDRRKPKPIDISKSPEVMASKARVQQLKESLNKKAQEYAKKNRTLTKRITDGIEQTFDASKNLTTSYDVSGLRQAKAALLSRPVTTLRNVPQMIRSLLSEDAARNQDQKRQNRPNATNGLDEKAKIEYTALDETEFSKREENLRSIWDEWAKSPLKTGNAAKTAITAPAKLLSRGVRASNRAFITFLNQVRADVFDAILAANFKDRAPTDRELEEIGNLVNIMTGRGKLNPMLARGLSLPFWSPKLLASRAQLLAGQPLYRPAADVINSIAGRSGDTWDTSRAARIILKEYVRMLAGAVVTGTIVQYVSALFGDKEENENTSSDWGKIRIGNTRIDLWGSFQQQLVLFNRLRKGETTSLKGETYKIRGPEKKFGSGGPGKVIENFLRTKANPIVGAAADQLIYGGENVIGEDVSWLESLAGITTPLSGREFLKLTNAHGIPAAIALQVLSSFGEGVSVYEDREENKEEKTSR